MQDRVQQLRGVEGLWRPLISSAEIAWVTGLLEGEGTFQMSGRSLTVSVRMTDRDIIERVAHLIHGYTFTLAAPPCGRPWKQQSIHMIEFRGCG